MKLLKNFFINLINVIKSISILNVALCIAIAIIVYCFVVLFLFAGAKIEESDLKVSELIKKDTITQKQKIELWYVGGFKDTIDIRIPIENKIDLKTHKHQPYL